MILQGTFKVTVDDEEQGKDFASALNDLLVSYDLYGSGYDILDPADDDDDEDPGEVPDAVKMAGALFISDSPGAVAAGVRFTPLRNLFKRIAARRAGVDEETIEKALVHLEAESDRPFLDWLTNGGFEKLLEIILKLLPLFLV